MGKVLDLADLAPSRVVRSTGLQEMGVVPICIAPGESDGGHSHTLVEEIAVVQHGEGRVQIENESFDLRAGSVAVVPAGKFHGLLQHRRSGPRRRRDLQF